MQGQALRDSAQQFAQHGCVIFGASFDSVEENRAFHDAQEMPFALLSDTDRTVGAQYDVIRPPGKYADYPRRRSFLIDPAGVLRRIYDVDDVAAHAQVVLDDLDVLQRS